MFTTIKQVPSNFFNKVAFDSGVLVKNWNKSAPFTITDEMIIAATTGDFNIASKPSVIDLFEDVNGVPNGSKEGVFVESWEHTIGVTAINTSIDVIKYALGVADVDNSTKSVVPRLGLAENSDFIHLTWIGQTVDGGLIVADLAQALSVEGLSITTGKNTKGQFPLTIRGYYSISSPDESPVAYYIIEPETVTVTFNSNGGSSVDSQEVTVGSKVTEPETPTKSGYEFNGWYKDSTFTDDFSFVFDRATDDMTLYAKWTEEE